MAPLLGMNHLRMIVALAKTGRLTTAAEELGVTPSALSHRIQEAERRLGVALVTRHHKRLRLTPAAEYLVQIAGRLLADLERAEGDIRRMNKGNNHVVRIATEFYTSYHWLPAFLKEFRKKGKNIDVQVMGDASRQVSICLLNRHIDLGILTDGTPQAGLIKTQLFTDELLFIMPRGHRLAGRRYIVAEDLKGEEFITYTKIPAPNREFAKLFRPSDVSPTWTATIELPEAIIDLVAAGFGVSILARWVVEGAARAKRISTARVGANGISIPWYVAIREQDATDYAIGELASSLVAWCATDSLGFRRRVA